jgi:hypothetical protein
MSILATPVVLVVASGVADLGAPSLGGRALAAPNALEVVNRVSTKEATIHDAFALDPSGSKLGYITLSHEGEVQLHVGPPGGKGKTTNLAEFSGAPEKLLTLGGYWFVVANEGARRAAIVDPAGRIKRQTGAFDDCELAHSPNAFVTNVQQRVPDGERYTVQSYRPDGSTLSVRTVVVTPGGTIAGVDSAVFLGFTKSHLQIMVQVPGGYDRRSDARVPSQFALYDMATGKIGPGKLPPNLDAFLDYVRKRAEKPDLDAVIVLATGVSGFELVGPGERVRHLDRIVEAQDYDLSSLQQVQVGPRVVFSLVADRPGNKKGDMDETRRFSQAFFSLEPTSGKVTALGEIPLSDKRPRPWSAGGNRIAVLRETADRGREIVIYSRGKSSP